MIRNILREERIRAKKLENIKVRFIFVVFVGLVFLAMALMDLEEQNQGLCDEQRELVRTSNMEWGEGFQELCGDYKVTK